MDSPNESPQKSVKRALRKQLVAARAAFAAGEVERRSQRVFETYARNAAAMLPPSPSKGALYFPVRGEVDTRRFHDDFRLHRMHCLYPRVKPGGDSAPLEFLRADDRSELRTGAYGIAEPPSRPGLVPEVPEIVLVPGVAFSERGFRLGYGGGHYDATIESWIAAGQRGRIVLIGLAYDTQLVPDLPREPHDHPMDFVVTESRVIKAGGAP